MGLVDGRKNEEEFNMHADKKRFTMKSGTEKGAGLVEYGLLAGLVVVASISVVSNLGSDVRSTFSTVGDQIEANTFEARVIAGLDRYPATCEEGTSRGDIFSDEAFESFDCVEMLGGNDQFITGSGGLSGRVYPGPGSDFVRWTQENPNLSVTYESGHDIYRLNGGTINFPFNFGDATFSYDTIGGISESFTITNPQGSVQFPDSLVWWYTDKLAQNFVFADQTLTQSEIIYAAANANATSGSDTIYTSNSAEEISPGAGDDLVSAGEGNDRIIYTSGNDTYYPGRHEDVLVIPYAQSEVRPYTWGNQSDLYININQTGEQIYVPLQYSNTDSSGQDVHFYEFEFTDGALSWDEVRVLAVSDNTTSGADFIYGSKGVDNFVIENASGRDWIQGNGGDDFYTYVTGNAYLKQRGDGTADTLDLSNWSSDEVTFSVGDKDGYVTIPAKGTSSGGVISMEKINTISETNQTHPVEYIIFSDKTMNHIEMRSAMGVTYTP